MKPFYSILLVLLLVISTVVAQKKEQTNLQLPQYPGGEKALKSFLQKNLKYPTQAKNRGIHGYVHCQFLVNVDSTLSDIKILKSPHKLLSNEAIRLIKLMPKFIPAKQNNKYIQWHYTLPIKFELEPIPVVVNQETNGTVIEANDLVEVDDWDIVEIPQQTVTIFSFVEEMPHYPDGDSALVSFIEKNLQYPQEAIDNEIEGNVFTQFIVSENGSLYGFKILRSPHPLLTQEALRIVNLLPAFTPGKQNGKNIPVYYNLPIRFKLKK